MALKLVHDDSVEVLSIYNFRDIADCARRYANQLEAGEQGEPVRLIVVQQFADDICISVWGENASGFEALGILEAAKLRCHEVNVVGED